jgi:hypothetical protein
MKKVETIRRNFIDVEVGHKSLFVLQRYLGNYTATAWEDNDAFDAINRFQDKLEDISKKIKERNANLEVPYTYLLPECIPNGTAI